MNPSFCDKRVLLKGILDYNYNTKAPHPTQGHPTAPHIKSKLKPLLEQEAPNFD